MTLILSGTDGLSDVDGSAATPAIRGTDANTGIFFPAADTIAFSEGGVESMRIDASGNVGIGTSSPGAKLHVSQGNTSVGALFNGTTRGIRFGFDATSSIIEGVDNTGVSSFQPLTVGGVDVRFTTSGTERARIDSSGNVGIGTSSPSGRLDVESSSSVLYTNLTTTAGGAACVLSLIGGSSSEQAICYNSSALRFGTVTGKNAAGFTERARIDSSGNLLVGTTTGAFRLNVTAATQGAGFALTNGSMLIREVGGTAANNTMEFHLRPNSGKSAYITFTEDSIDDRWSIGIQNANANLRFLTGVGGSGTERMNLSSGGNLTISGATATKASGTTWANPSDQRLKDNIRDYAKGTTELMQVRVREWEYNGKGGTTEGMKGLGVIADEVMVVLPNTVENYDAKLNADDEETTAIKKFDATEITWLLVKTVQEQQAIITSLTDRITALEAK
jgi:hypothetical protein